MIEPEQSTSENGISDRKQNPTFTLEGLIKHTIVNTLKRTMKKKRGYAEVDIEDSQLLATLRKNEEARTLDLVEVFSDLEEAMESDSRFASIDLSNAEEEIVCLAQKETTTVGEVIATTQRLLRTMMMQRRTA